MNGYDSPGEIEWQRKTKALGGKPAPVPRFLPQIPHGRQGNRTRISIGDSCPTAKPAVPYHLFDCIYKYSDTSANEDNSFRIHIR
jgi:hypothetical protein